MLAVTADAAWRLRPNAPPPGTRLGPLSALADSTARGYRVGRGLAAFRMFVVHRNGQVYGYLNLCPHFSLPLNDDEHGFLNADATQLVCSRHFATFRIEDGICISGACLNSALDRVPLIVDAEGFICIAPEQAS